MYWYWCYVIQLSLVLALTLAIYDPSNPTPDDGNFHILNSTDEAGDGQDREPSFSHSVVDLPGVGRYQILLQPNQTQLDWADVHFLLADEHYDYQMEPVSDGAAFQSPQFALPLGSKLDYFFTIGLAGTESPLESPVFSFSSAFEQSCDLIGVQGLHRISLGGSDINYAEIVLSSDGSSNVSAVMSYEAYGGFIPVEPTSTTRATRSAAADGSNVLVDPADGREALSSVTGWFGSVLDSMTGLLLGDASTGSSGVDYDNISTGVDGSSGQEGASTATGQSSRSSSRLSPPPTYWLYTLNLLPGSRVQYFFKYGNSTHNLASDLFSYTYEDNGSEVNDSAAEVLSYSANDGAPVSSSQSAPPPALQTALPAQSVQLTQDVQTAQRTRGSLPPLLPSPGNGPLSLIGNLPLIGGRSDGQSGLPNPFQVVRNILPTRARNQQTSESVSSSLDELGALMSGPVTDSASTPASVESVEQNGSDALDQTDSEAVDQSGLQAVRQSGSEAVDPSGLQDVQQRSGLQAVDESGLQAVAQSGFDEAGSSVETLQFAATIEDQIRRIGQRLTVAHSGCNEIDYSCQLNEICSGCGGSGGDGMCALCQGLRNCVSTECQTQQVCNMCNQFASLSMPSPAVCTALFC